MQRKGKEHKDMELLWKSLTVAVSLSICRLINVNH